MVDNLTSMKTRISMLAGVCGSFAWGAPMLIQRFLPRFVNLPFPANTLAFLLEEILAYTVGALLASYFYLLILRELRVIHLDNVSNEPIIYSFISYTMGGIITALIGLGLASSQLAENLLSLFDISSVWPEPFLSVGLILGAVTTVLFLILTTDVPWQLFGEEGNGRGKVRLVTTVFTSSILARVASLIVFWIFMLLYVDLYFADVVTMSLGGAFLGIFSARLLFNGRAA
jgi:hypothetical protein